MYPVKVNLEMIPAISPLVFKLLSHPQEVLSRQMKSILNSCPPEQAVRKKAVVAVHKFFKIVPEAVLDQKDTAGCGLDGLRTVLLRGSAQPASPSPRTFVPARIKYGKSCVIRILLSWGRRFMSSARLSLSGKVSPLQSLERMDRLQKLIQLRVKILCLHS